MAGVGRDERLVKNKRGILESGIEIAKRPLVGSLAHRETTVLFLAEIGLGPLELGDYRSTRTLGAGCWRPRPDIPIRSRVGPTRPQRVERIDHKRQRLKIDFNFLDGFGGREFIDRGDRENRFTLINRLHRETAFTPLTRLDHRSIVA